MIATYQTNRRWTDQEVATLNEMYERGCIDAEIAKAIGRGEEAVREKRRRLANEETYTNIARQAPETDANKRHKRALAWNRRAHQLYEESDGELGWPRGEWRDLPRRGERLEEPQVSE